ncbi:MAG TPA: diguanylate cyclase [Miltoncostaeaceae bacterium]|nr:diguanylate cyclase [Miltoncostaeaceae bacterium]
MTAGAAVPTAERIDDPDALFEDAPCGYLVLSPEARIVRANATLRRWTGRDDLDGRDLREILAPGSRGYLEAHLRPALRAEGRAAEAPVELLHADGRRVHALLEAATVHDASGRPVAVRAVLVGASRRRAYERELRLMRDRELTARAWTERLLTLTATLATARTSDEVVGVLQEAAAEADPGGSLAILLAGEGHPRLVGAYGDPGIVETLVAAHGAGAPRDDAFTVLAMGTDDRVLGWVLRRPGTDGADPGGAERFMRGCAMQGGAALERTRLHEELARRALTDDLTALPNRRAGIERLEAELARARRGGGDVCVGLADIDHFKRFNDTRGHAAGDDLLRAAAAAWRAVVRADDLLARHGGEEFLLVMAGCGLEEARVVCERMRRATPGDATCSIGVAGWDRAEDAAALTARADAALYRAKDAGRDRVVAAG